MDEGKEEVHDIMTWSRRSPQNGIFRKRKALIDIFQCNRNVQQRMAKLT
jgi:hypothetical protein